MYSRVGKTKRSGMARRNCWGLLLLVVVCSAFMWVFSYADNFTRVRSKLFRAPGLGGSYLGGSFSAVNFTWSCQGGKCVKTILVMGEAPSSLDTCNMMCNLPPIWPKPRTITTPNKTSSVITQQNIIFSYVGRNPAPAMMEKATELFRRNLELLASTSKYSEVKVNVSIILEDNGLIKIKLNTDEGYKLSVRKTTLDVDVRISAHNYFGARHGLETLSQLIWYDNGELRILHDVEIEDAPAFPYRGLMVDTARNFFPVDQLKKVVDGMGASKLNVFHLHLADWESFSIVLPSIPELAEFGAYGPDMVHTPENIKGLIEYAAVRGVRVILEIDAPSHVNAGWNFGQLLNETLVICGEHNVAKGHLNPDNGEALNILEYIYGDLLDLVEDDEIFHIGGDEVDLNCWRQTEAAKRYADTTRLWVEYTNQMLERLKIANDNAFPGHIMMWSSPLTNNFLLEDINFKVTVQSWLGDPRNFLSKGHSVIYSTVGHWYLDCGFGVWRPDMTTGICDPYTPWQKFYSYRPWVEYGHKEQALGGEACLWAEQVGVDQLETRIWPRAAAFAERLWRDPQYFDDYDVYTRLVSHSERLSSRGIKTAAMWPRWCSQNPGKCGFK